MNKSAIKTFAIWARNKLIADITYKAGVLGITEKEIKSPLPQSTPTVQFFDIGTKEPYSITGEEISQRAKLAAEFQRKAEQSDYNTAFKAVVEEVAYTWFNRLIAVRFMEVNDYLPTHIRVLSSESSNKAEPDLVTNPMDADLEYTPYEKDRIMQLKNENQLDELFRMLFIKQCNVLNAILPELFEKTSDYTELLLNVSFTDQDGVVCHLVNDIDEDNFNVSKEGQVEIIGWLYQYYNTEPKDETFALIKKNVKVTKERIPAATQLFTPDWIVRYMVENSLGRLWLEGHPNDDLKAEWKYYLDEAEQEVDVQKQLDEIREEYKTIKPEDIKVIDPCMGSGHILVYAFDVLMKIYESYGYSQRDAAKSIIENNIYGLDIDNRAYQLAYFAVIMKARQYNRRILNGETNCQIYAIQESNEINMDQLRYFGAGMDEIERNTTIIQMQGLLNSFTDAKEYGSILNVENYNWKLLYQFVDNIDMNGQMTFDTIGIEDTQNQLRLLVKIGAIMARKYDVVVTNPPYMGISNSNGKLNDYLKKNYPDSKSDLFAVFIEKCGQMLGIYRYQAMITQQSWMFLSSFEKLRAKLQIVDTVNMAHLGARAFEEIGGEVVQTTAFAMRKAHVPSYKGVYVRLVEPTTQQGKEDMFLRNSNRFATVQDNFSKIPGMPISYWGNKNVFDLFRNKINLGEISEPKSGLSSTDNDRFLRFWYEVNFDNIDFKCISVEQAANSVCKWFCLNKGGDYRKWYGNRWYVVNWENNGYEIKETTKGAVGGRVVNTEYYFKESISCGAITSGENSFRLYPEGAIFDTNFRSLFFKQEEKYYYFGLLNSIVIEYIGKMLCSTIKLNANDLSRLPVVIGVDVKDIVESLVLQCIDISRNDWNSCERSWEFAKHPLLCSGNTIKSAFEKWADYTLVQFNKLKFNEEEINRIFIKLYGLEDELKAEIACEKVTVCKADLKRDIRSFISYAVGCIFGRYSLDIGGLVYAGCQWDDSKYSTFIPDKDNILPITDEEYFEDDIVGLFVAFVKKVYGAETLQENLDFIANALENKGNNSREIIRNYFVKDFFKDHCKIYQKRPIYWLFDSGKADGFKALIYMHRYDENTIGNLRIDYLHRMQRVYESEIARMQETITNSPDAREVAAATKRKEKLVKQLKEAKEYDEKIAHLALARIAIDLDDGVKVNYEKVQIGTDGQKMEVLAKI